MAHDYRAIGSEAIMLCLLALELSNPLRQRHN